MLPILVIEEDRTLRDLLVSLLTSEEYDAVPVTDASAVMELATRHRPAAIVLDVGLNFAIGMRLLKELRASTDTRSIPVLALSDNPEPPAGCAAWCGDEPLLKPFDLTVLLEQLARVLESSTLKV
jgi:DNA-binding response OmpR family regulator